MGADGSVPLLSALRALWMMYENNSIRPRSPGLQFAVKNVRIINTGVMEIAYMTHIICRDGSLSNYEVADMASLSSDAKMLDCLGRCREKRSGHLGNRIKIYSILIKKASVESRNSQDDTLSGHYNYHNA